nr:hypothetical protein [Bacteroidales bacterium]
ETGQDPASVKWKQIRSSHFNVIFPESFEKQGIEYSRMLEKATEGLHDLYPVKKFRIPVVLHSYSTRSNGYVAWAPSRMELYPTPEQNSIPLGTSSQLAFHEMVHVNQLLSLNSGFTRGASFLLGQQAAGAVAVFLPLWLLEGEAVFGETAMSASGRGRAAFFQKELKALSVEKGSLYSYDKMINGSYRNYVPDHYQLGYQAAAWGRLKYGDQVWNDAFRKTGREPFTLNPVNISLRAGAGTTKKKLLMEAFDSLGTTWRKDMGGNLKKDYNPLNPPKKGQFRNYYCPVAAGSDSIIAIRTSLSAIPVFVLINPAQKTEKAIHTPGLIYPYYISYAAKKIVWVETQYDMRWENRDFSVIKILDLNTGRVRRLTSGSRYMAASISPGGDRIAAVETPAGSSGRLVLLDSGTGAVNGTADAPANSHLQRPQWSSDGKTITFVSLDADGESVLAYSLTENTWRTIRNSSREDIQSAVMRNDSLFYIGSAGGTDDVYVQTAEGRIAGITKSRFGVGDFSLRGNTVYFSDYTSAGNNIAGTALSEAYSDSGNKDRSYLINRFSYSDKTSIPSPDTSVLVSRSYRKWTHLFRFHSWMPFYADLDEIMSDPASVRPGLTLMSQNTLSTLISTIGYEYSAEGKHLLHSSVSWKGWYPVFDFEVDYGDDPLVIRSSGSAGAPSDIRRGITSINTVSVPLRFSAGPFFQYLRPSYTIEYSNDYIYIPEDQAYDYGQSITTARLYFSNYRRYAWRDINPRLAQSVDISYTYAPWDSDIYGTSLSLRSSFWFPGFLRNHSIRLRYEGERQDPSRFMYGNKVGLPRGYTDIRSRERDLISGDYVMPLLYPDLNLASFFYLTRIRGALFYDYEKAFGNTYYSMTSSGTQQNVYHGYEEIFKSYGLELMGDFYVLRLPFEVSAGVRSAWTAMSSSPVVSMLFTIDIYGMNIGRDRRRPY